jgi:hypothetical protein
MHAANKKQQQQQLLQQARISTEFRNSWWYQAGLEPVTPALTGLVLLHSAQNASSLLCWTKLIEAPEFLCMLPACR